MDNASCGMCAGRCGCSNCPPASSPQRPPGRRARQGSGSAGGCTRHAVGSAPGLTWMVVVVAARLLVAALLVAGPCMAMRSCTVTIAQLHSHYCETKGCAEAARSGGRCG